MFRRALLAAPLLLPLPALAQPRAAALSERDRRDVAAIEAYLNRMTTPRARFLQIAQNGASAPGWACLLYPSDAAVEWGGLDIRGRGRTNNQQLKT